MVILIVSVGSIGKDVPRWETPEEWRRGFHRALIRRKTRLTLAGEVAEIRTAPGGADAFGFG
jgi:hypothetical protein